MADEKPSMRVPPFKTEAEQNVIGAIFLSEDSWTSIESILKPTDFYHTGHRMIWKAFMELAADTEPLDIVTLAAKLNDRLIQVSTPSYEGHPVTGQDALMYIYESTLSAANVVAYANIVRQASRYRAAIRDFNKGIEAAFDQDAEGIERIRDLIIAAGYEDSSQRPWRMAMDVTPRITEWLWHEWLPKGELTLFAAPGGSGKGTFWCYLAACVTAGREWPDGSTTEPANIAIYSPEDSPDKELVPRLSLAGADLSRCYIADTVDAIRRLPDLDEVALVVLDPIRQGMAGKSDNESDVRPHITPWMAFAQERNIALMGVHHFGKYAAAKSGTPARDLPVGSAAWVDVSRWVLLLGRDHGDENGSRVLIRAKGNLGGVDYSQGAYRIWAQQGIAGMDGDAEIKNASVTSIKFEGGIAEDIFFNAITPPQSRERDIQGSEEAQAIMDSIRERGGISCARWIVGDTSLARGTVDKWIRRMLKQKRVLLRKPTPAEAETGLAKNAKAIVLDDPPEVRTF